MLKAEAGVSGSGISLTQTIEFTVFPPLGTKISFLYTNWIEAV
jgi:hypothetical protein